MLLALVSQNEIVGALGFLIIAIVLFFISITPEGRGKI